MVRSRTFAPSAAFLTAITLNAGAFAQAPAVTVPSGTDLIGGAFHGPGPWPGKVTAANINNTTAPGGVLNGTGSNYLEHQITSGPLKWTLPGSNEGDIDLNISPFDPNDSRYFPVGNFWQPYRDNCGGAWPVPPQPVASVPTSACANWGRLNNPASGPITYAWAVQPANGIILAAVRDNGRDNLNTLNVGGAQVGIQYATAWISADDFRGSFGYSMIDGTLRNGLGSVYASFGSVGASQEIITNVSYGWFPFQQGWIGGYSTTRFLPPTPTDGLWLVAATGPDRIAATPGLSPTVVQWASRGRASLELGGTLTPANGMVFLTSTQADNNTPILLNVLPGATGWTIAERSADSFDTSGNSTTDGRGANEDSFCFLYVPFTAPGLIGGNINGATGAATHSAGAFTLVRTAAGQYTLTIPGKTDADGALFFQANGSIPGNPALPDRAFITRQFDAASGTFRIQARELVSGADVFGEDHPLRDASFSFFWVDFTNPLKPKCVGDYNANGALSVQDIFDFLAAWFAGNILADTNGDGALAVQDIFDFLAAWFGGC